ncbi:ribulose-phosphate 3-epimerase [Nanoarchaeota archaeon]
MPELVAAILVHSKAQLKKNLETFAPLRWAQIDVMDGRFVNNKTISASALKDITTSLNLEAHLMTFNPLKHAKQYAKYCKKIIFHYEACKTDQEIIDVINFCRQHRLKVGLAINPPTKIKKIQHFLPVLDLILVMSIMPGFSGQRFRPSSIKKVKELRKLNKKIDIEVDGGVNFKNAKQLIKAGATHLVSRSAILKYPDIKTAKKEFKKI